MRKLRVRTFRDLMDGHQYAEIRCPVQQKVVRRLSQAADRVEIRTSEPPILSVGLNEPIGYSPWVMDRGSLTFTHSEMPGTLKICTELDIIRFDDGTEAVVVPLSGGVTA